jgi:hypothetical protein
MYLGYIPAKGQARCLIGSEVLKYFNNVLIMYCLSEISTLSHVEAYRLQNDFNF